MRNLDTSFADALNASRDSGIVPRTFVYVTAKDRDTGAPVSIGLWSGDEDVDFTVISGVTGLPVTRSYYGAVNLSVSSIPRVSDLTTQTVTIEMSQVAEITQLLVRGYDVRLAKVEIHEITLDTSSRLPSAVPDIAFLGEVDGAPIDTPAVGQDGRITISLVSDAISMLERVNPAKSSAEGQKRRSGDQWGKYSSTVGSWKIPWGQEAS